MQISRIRIENFRSIASLDLTDLLPALVLVGENGSGKSTLLEALRLVLDPSLSDSARELDETDFYDGTDAPFGGREIRVVVELTDFADDLRAKALLEDSVTDRDPLTARLTYVYRPRGGVDHADANGPDTYEHLSFRGDNEGLPFGADVRRFLSVRVLPALRDAHGDLRTWSRSPLADLLRRLAIEPERLQAVADTAVAATEELLEDKDAQDLIDGLNERLVALVGEVFAQPLALGVSASRSDQVLRAIRVLVDDGRDLDRTSLGLANVIYLVLLLEQVADATAAGDRVSTILGVEEPEAHLHPHLQRVLFRSLLESQPPLMLTTHSAQIASVTPLRSLALLRRGPHGTTARTVAGAGLTELQIADLQRYLDVTRAEMLFARGVVLVEGAAELFLIPAFAERMGLPLDELGISVCAVHGTDFAPYTKLLGPEGFDVPRVVVTDGDADPQGRRERVHTGLKRARRLIAGLPGGLVQRALDAEDWDQARSRLASRGVFVGQHTLEVDMLPAAAGAMQATMAELGASDQVQARFTAAIAAAPAGSPADRAKLIGYIERYGKGRFAQRLAGHLDDVDAPEYVEQALTALRDRLA